MAGSEARLLAIGEVAEQAGMSVSRIRYYESCGVLAEPERRSGKRRYTRFRRSTSRSRERPR